MNQRLKVILLSLLVWASCLGVGTYLSSLRLLWNDELFTETQSLSLYSYPDILAGRIPDGNNAPLFYVIQKGFRDVFHVRLPFKWEAQWFVYEPQAQIMLRVMPNVFMSTALALIFYFFARFYSLAMGLFALAVTLSAPMTWFYWPEARPYAMWFLFTTAQSLLFLRIVANDARPSTWRWLTVIHLLLGLTVVLGAMQVSAVCALLWLFKERRWRHYVLTAAVPVAISVFYYLRSPKFKLFFSKGPWQLFTEAVPLEFWLLFAAYAAVVLWLRRARSQATDHWWPQAAFFLTIFVCAGMLMGYLVKTGSAVSVGFAISSRYFIFLVPVAAIAASWCVADLWQRFKGDPWMRLNLLIVAGGFLALRAGKTLIDILSSGTFMHVIR